MSEKGKLRWRLRGDADVQIVRYTQIRAKNNRRVWWLVSVGIGEDEQHYQVRRPLVNPWRR